MATTIRSRFPGPPDQPGDRPPLKVADVFRRYGHTFCAGHSLTALQRDATSSIEFYRTASLAVRMKK